MKRKHLQSALEDVRVFANPKYQLEQYPTSPHLASHMVFAIEQMYGDIVGKNVADLGCGCGMLTIASRVMGAKYNVGFDLDTDALAICKQNLEEYDIQADLVHCDMNKLLHCLRTASTKPQPLANTGENSGSISRQHEDVHVHVSARPSTTDTNIFPEIEEKMSGLNVASEGGAKEVSAPKAASEEDEEKEQHMMLKEQHMVLKLLIQSESSGKGEGEGEGEVEGEDENGDENICQEEEVGERKGGGLEFRDVKFADIPKIDTVIMNPPFGTRNKGIDMVFLEAAIRLSGNSVYSLHKSSTRKHILKRAIEWGVEAKVLGELRFDIPQMYAFHKKKSVDVEVDLIRFSKASGVPIMAHSPLPALQDSSGGNRRQQRPGRGNKGGGRGGKGKGGRGRGGKGKRGPKSGGGKSSRRR